MSGLKLLAAMIVLGLTGGCCTMLPVGGCGGGHPVADGCGHGTACGSCQPTILDALFPLISYRLTCGSGCGPMYWGEWISDPPDCPDPCGSCGPDACCLGPGQRLWAGLGRLWCSGFGLRCLGNAVRCVVCGGSLNDGCCAGPVPVCSSCQAAGPGLPATPVVDYGAPLAMDPGPLAGQSYAPPLVPGELTTVASQEGDVIYDDAMIVGDQAPPPPTDLLVPAQVANRHAHAHGSVLSSLLPFNPLGQAAGAGPPPSMPPTVTDAIRHRHGRSPHPVVSKHVH